MLVLAALAVGAWVGAQQTRATTSPDTVGNCEPGWLATFGEQPGVSGFPSNTSLRCFAVFDAGDGPALYAGGQFSSAGSTTAKDIASWDGTRWQPLGSGVASASITDGVFALAVFDDGGGPALFIGGSFDEAGDGPASNIAKWDGLQWSPLGSGIFGTVHALQEFDDGSGTALYAAGAFVVAGGQAAQSIARWDGASWAPLGSGLDGTVRALEVFDDGSGPALYAGGSFANAGGVPAQNIAKWNGTSWSALGGGTGEVFDLVVFDDGGGPALLAAAGGVARWDGASWSTLGGLADARSLAVLDESGSPVLYAGEAVPDAISVARWNGASWAGIGSGTGSPVHGQVVLAAFDPGSGPDLFVGGGFLSMDDLEVNRIARWDGLAWSALSPGLLAEVEALTLFDSGAGPALHAAIRGAGGGASPSRVAHWNGASWSELGGGFENNGLDNRVLALATFDDGSGPALHAAGAFTSADGAVARRVAKWDGNTWSGLGAGLASGPLTVSEALAVFDDGQGPALFAAGFFSFAGSLTANNIARWDGSSWSRLGSAANNGVPDRVHALVVHDDGSGPALYVGGDFTPVPAPHVARWDGFDWSPLGSGVNGSVLCFAEFDDGSGPALYVGGSFDSAGGVAVNQVARWDGTNWSSLGGVALDFVSALAVFDDGSGPALHAAGTYTWPDGRKATNIARWNGTSWNLLGGEMSDGVRSLIVYDDGGGPALLAGGWFAAHPSGDSFLARWTGCAPALALQTIAPALGSYLGGEPVRLTGSGFVPGTTVSFDGAPGAVTSIAPGQLEVSAPSRAPNGKVDAVDVVVTTPFGGRATLLDGFTYVLARRR